MNPPVHVDRWRRFRNRMLLLTLSPFCGVYSVMFVIVLPTWLFPELQDPLLALHETAIIKSMDALRIINNRTGVRAYAFDEHGVLTFQAGDTALSEDALLRRDQDLSSASPARHIKGVLPASASRA